MKRLPADCRSRLALLASTPRNTTMVIERRTFVQVGAAHLLSKLIISDSLAEALPQTHEPLILSPPIERAPTLLSAPIELAGNWGQMLPRPAQLVVERMRSACLDGVR